MNKQIVLSFISSYFIIFGSIVMAQDSNNKFTYHEEVKGKDTFRYRVLYPVDFTENKKYPLVLFLHGAGERGNDNEKQLIHGAKLFQDSIEKYPSIVIFPQCSAGDYWALMETETKESGRTLRRFATGDPSKAMQHVIDLIDRMQAERYVDTDRMHVLGLSMGGMGTFELLWRRPGTFASAISICGGGAEEKTPLMAKTPLWIIHGMKDDVVNPNYSIRLCRKIQAAGGRAKISLYTDANHNSWDPAFAEKDFLQWLFSYHRTNN